MSKASSYREPCRTRAPHRLSPNVLPPSGPGQRQLPADLADQSAFCKSESLAWASAGVVCPRRTGQGMLEGRLDDQFRPIRDEVGLCMDSFFRHAMHSSILLGTSSTELLQFRPNSERGAFFGETISKGTVAYALQTPYPLFQISGAWADRRDQATLCVPSTAC